MRSPKRPRHGNARRGHQPQNEWFPWSGIKIKPDYGVIEGDPEFSFRRFDTKGGFELKGIKSPRRIFFFKV